MTPSPAEKQISKPVILFYRVKMPTLTTYPLYNTHYPSIPRPPKMFSNPVHLMKIL